MNKNAASPNLLTIESAALGRLASGAAYELSPPVSRALVNLRIFLNGQPPAPDHGDVDLVRRALSSVEQIASTVHALHAFTTIEDEARGVDVHEAIEVAIGFARKEITEHATLLRRYAPVRRAQGSMARIAHVLVNVLDYASASIPRSAPADDAIEVATGLTPNGRITIDITDSGDGIEADDLPFVFDPFFSTNARERSHGLGLAAARAALVEMGGTIAVDSTVGRGSRFRITLSAVENDDVPALPVYDRETLPERRVLCVADTPSDALRLGELAEDTDTRVMFATWVDALDRLALGETFDLILCDGGAPGRATFQKQLAHTAPSEAAHTFAIAMRSNRSGTFTRATAGDQAGLLRSGGRFG